jgi:hypothetical protein
MKFDMDIHVKTMTGTHLDLDLERANDSRHMRFAHVKLIV